MDNNFVVGLIYGIFIAVILGLILRQMSEASKTIKQKNKALDTFPDAIQPKLTPAGIFWKSVRAMIAWFFWLLVLLGFLRILLWIFNSVLMV